MLLPTTTVLRELIIRELAAATSLSAPALGQALERRGHSFTKQAVYKELRYLESQGVVARSRGTYSLSITWVLMLVSLTDQMYESYIEKLPLETILPAPQKKIRWQFRSLLRLLDFWTQVIFLLFQRSPSRMFYEWVPHPWFVLVQREKTLSLFLEAIRIGKFQVRAIIGGTTFLDRAFADASEMPKDLYRCAFAESSFHSQRGNYIGTLDEFLIVAEIDSNAVARIEELYDTVHSPADLTPQRLGHLFNTPGKFSLVLENDTPRARKTAREFRDYFGDSHNSGSSSQG